MKRTLIVILLLTSALFAITEEQYHEFMNKLDFKIGIHSWYNNIDYNGKYLTKWDNSHFVRVSDDNVESGVQNLNHVQSSKSMAIGLTKPKKAANLNRISSV